MATNNLVSNMIPPSRIDQDDAIFTDISDSELVDENGEPIVDEGGDKVRGKKK